LPGRAIGYGRENRISVYSWGVATEESIAVREATLKPEIRLAVAFMVLMVLVSPHLAQAAGALEGRWLLVERTHGEGGLNLARGQPVELLLFRDETGALAGRISVGGEPSQVFPWPGLPRGEAGPPIQVLKSAENPAEALIRTSYRVRMAAGSRAMEVVETLRVSESGDFLEATWEVTAFEGGEDGGTLVLHGRFERLP
jgi:hypothetical protein